MVIERATLSDVEDIWKIILYAKESRRLQGSEQWQNGYPFRETIIQDIEKSWGYVVRIDGKVEAYVAVITEGEPAYEAIEGQWLKDGDYWTVHRMAVSEAAKGKRLGQWMLQAVGDKAAENKVFSIRIDTNFDNLAMLKILENLEYTYCGEVQYNGSPRKAFEKGLMV